MGRYRDEEDRFSGSKEAVPTRDDDEAESGYEQWEEAYLEGDDGSLEEAYLLDPDEDFDEADLLFAENVFEPHMVGSPTPRDSAHAPDVPESEELTDEASTDPYEVIEGGQIYYPPEDPPTLPSQRLRDVDVAGGFATSADDVPYDAYEEPIHLEVGDLEIAEHVREALRLHAETHDLDVRVQVVDGVATLRGRVRTLQDVLLAEDVVSEVEGVEEVREQLTVD